MSRFHLLPISVEIGRKSIKTMTCLYVEAMWHGPCLYRLVELDVKN